MPVILLLDVSGSMSYDGKIERLYDAVVDMVDSFAEEAIKEQEYNVAIFTFGGNTGLHTPYTPVLDLKKNGINRFTASGGTPLATALAMAKDYIEDKDETKGSDYLPNVILVSDGWPDGGWESEFKNFKNSGRSSRTLRFSIPIGSDANFEMMKDFASPDPDNPGNLLYFYAENANELVKCFKKVVTSISTRSRLKDPNSVTVGNGSFDRTPGTSVSKSRFAKSRRSDEDDGDEI